MKYFKIYRHIIQSLNLTSLSNKYSFSLHYGVYFNNNLKEIESTFCDNSNFFNIFFKQIKFENNTNYIFKIRWENEIHILISLSNYLNKNYKNIKVTIDLSHVNEQLDFSKWVDNKFINN